MGYSQDFYPAALPFAQDKTDRHGGKKGAGTGMEDGRTQASPLSPLLSSLPLCPSPSPVISSPLLLGGTSLSVDPTTRTRQGRAENGFWMRRVEEKEDRRDRADINDEDKMT